MSSLSSVLRRSVAADVSPLIPSNRQVLRSREMDSLARAVNPVEGEDEKNGAKQSEQQIG